MRTSVGLGIVISFLVVVGCSSSDTGGDQSGQQSSAASTTSGAGGEGGGGTSSSSGAGGAGGGSSADPEPPVIDSVEPLGGALHVAWTNVTKDCTAIELDRNKDGGAYALAYTLIGSATSQHDDQAMAPGTYCYKARCKKDAKISADSNEKCGKP